MDKSKLTRRSYLSGSDEVPDIYCEPCHQDGHVAIAEGYCVDCPEYLCGPCYKIHRWHKALANHVLLDKDSMPMSTDSRRNIVDVCEEKCPIHANKVIELFCETCDKLACIICVTTDHRKCEKVKHIPNIVKDIKYDKQFKKFKSDIKSTANALCEYDKKLQEKVIFNSEMGTLSKQELKHQIAEVDTFFEQFEKKVDGQTTTIKQRNQDRLKAASDRLDYVKTEFDQIKNDIEARNAGKSCGLFIAMKRSQEKMKTFQDQFGKMQADLRIQHYILLPSEQIQAMMRTTTEMCSIATAKLESEIDIKTSTDTKDPSIFDLTILQGHYCVVLDNDNKSIKIIDTNRKCVTSEVTIKADFIWSVTLVSDDQLAVSVSLSDDRNQMQFFTVSASGVIQRTKQLNVGDYYIDMVHCEDNIYGLKLDMIDKLDMTGEIIRTIQRDQTIGMARIAVSPDGQTLCN